MAYLFGDFMSKDLLQDLKSLIKSIERDIEDYPLCSAITEEVHINAKNEIVLELLDLVSRYEGE